MHLIDDSHNVPLQMCPPTGLVSSPKANTLFTLKELLKKKYTLKNLSVKKSKLTGPI